MNKFKSDKFVSIFLILLTSIFATLFVLFLIYSAVFKVENKILSVINYYNFEVNVEFLNNKVKLNPFETLTFTFNSKDNFIISAKDLNNTQLNKIEIENLNLGSQLISVVLTSSNDYCFFSANITNYFTSKENSINNINILTNTPKNYFIFGINNTYSVNTFPGSPAPIENELKFKDVKGHYPILCKNINNQESIVNTVKSFLNYSAVKQQEYLNTQLNIINNANTLEELNNL